MATKHLNRWGYKGTETALNGLTSWIQDNTEMKGSAHQLFLDSCKLVVAYGKHKFPDFKERGHLERKADYLAKRIDRENLFNDFVSWFREKVL